jgi:hypothetical protein
MEQLRMEMRWCGRGGMKGLAKERTRWSVISSVK